MKIYSQRDPRWKDVILGKSNTTIGDYGCTITCLAMLTELTPDEVNRRMNAAGAFANGNLVDWRKLKSANLGLEFEWRGYTYDNNAVKSAIGRFGGCLVEVDFDGNPRTGLRHWVLFRGNQKLWDPWTGTERPTSAYSMLTGFSVIAVKPLQTVDPLEKVIKDIRFACDEPTTNVSKIAKIKEIVSKV